MRKILISLLIISLSLASFTQSSAISGSTVKWTKTHQDKSGTLNSVACKDGVYVAVGDEGQILTSKDGSTWDWVDSHTSLGLNKVISNGKIFVALGDNGVILTSYDGTSWTRRDSPTSTRFDCVIWNGSYFLAMAFFPYKSYDGINWEVAKLDLKSFQTIPDFPASLVWDGRQFLLYGDGTIFSSKDGCKWEVKSKNLKNPYSELTWNGRMYLLVGDFGRYATSGDGITWVERDLRSMSEPDSVFEPNLNSVIWTGDEFIAIGSDGSYDYLTSVIISSKDGVNWNNMPNSGNCRLYGITRNAGDVVCVGGKGTILKYSFDKVWNKVSEANSIQYNSIAFNGKSYVAVGEKGKIYKSEDAVNWRNVIVPNQYNFYIGAWDLMSVAWNGQVFVIVGSRGITLSSADGENWNINFVSDLATDYDYNFQSVIWDGTQFIAIAKNYSTQGGEVYTSVDGMSWSKGTVKSPKYLNSIAASSSTRVMVGDGGTIFASSDGKEWTKAVSPTDKDLTSITYDGNEFRAVGIGVNISSTDGVKWQSRLKGINSNISYVIWDGKRFVGTCTDSSGYVQYMAFSNNGVDWKSYKLAQKVDHIDTIIWDGKKYIASYDNGNSCIATSTDGLNWAIRKDMGKSGWIIDIINAGNQYIAVGTQGRIVTSKDGITWTIRKSGTNVCLRNVAWDGKQYIAVGGLENEQVILTSKDGVNWKYKLDDKSYNTPNKIIWNGKQLLILKDEDTVQVSKDGVKWTNKDTGLNVFNDVLWNGKFYVAGVGGFGGPCKIMTSTDGLNWTDRLDLDGDRLYANGINSIAWNGKTYIAVSGTQVFYSSDAVNWYNTLFAPQDGFTCIASNGKSYVAGGFGGWLCTSKDGVGWNPVSTNTSKPIKSIIWDGNKYVVLCDDGVVFTGEFK